MSEFVHHSCGQIDDFIATHGNVRRPFFGICQWIPVIQRLRGQMLFRRQRGYDSANTSQGITRTIFAVSVPVNDSYSVICRAASRAAYSSEPGFRYGEPARFARNVIPRLCSV